MHKFWKQAALRGGLVIIWDPCSSFLHALRNVLEFSLALLSLIIVHINQPFRWTHEHFNKPKCLISKNLLVEIVDLLCSGYRVISARTFLFV